MKKYFLVVALLFLVSIVDAQTYTFSNTTTASVNSTAVTLRNVTVSGVPTTGMVLRQVNVYFGNGSSLYSGDMSGFTLTLTDPSGNVVNLITPSGSFTTSGSSNSANKIFNIKFRDHAGLKTPKAQMTATSSTLSKGYPFNQGYYKPEGNFSSFNTTTNVNGTWGFRMSGYSTSYARTFNSVELIFGPPFVVTDIRGTNPNQSCANRQCFQTGDLFWARNVGYPTNQASAPPNTVGGCGWNGQKDNMAWFYFKASSTTATISASGFSTVQESSVFKTTDCSSYSAVTGGCGPSDLFAGSPHITKYFNGSYAGGYAWNQGYSLSGLTIGDEYIFVLDGQSGTQSEFYIEMLAGGDGGCSTLPVKLTNYEITCNKGKAELNWTTTTEINNDYFIVEKAIQNNVKDELNFFEVARI
ncbi:MAG: hypothetical protein KDD24_07905, partial [Flavobacteriales bacterium]|nr:hypothetical protein [Flavobacteriales bacterium]